jgi:hypothetical protein
MYRNQLKNLTRKLSYGWTLAMLLPIKLMADLPDAGDIAEDADTSAPLQFIRDIAEIGVGIAAPIVAAIVSLAVAGYLFTSFKDSREKGDWGKFGVTFVVGAVLIVSVIVIALLAMEYAEPPA